MYRRAAVSLNAGSWSVLFSFSTGSASISSMAPSQSTMTISGNFHRFPMGALAWNGSLNMNGCFPQASAQLCTMARNFLTRMSAMSMTSLSSPKSSRRPCDSDSISLALERTGTGAVRL